MPDKSTNNKIMGIYIHIPFCSKKCNYCDFISFTADEAMKKSYVYALLKEISFYSALYGKNAPGRRTVTTVFFGGGTPSIIDSKYISLIMETLADCFDFAKCPEITIECNPGTLTAAKLSDYKHAGLNRLSIGLQSAHDAELHILGRIHSRSDFDNSFKAARHAGFDNINVDIMSALPGQTLSSYIDTLNSVISFEPEHISSYSLIIEEGTPFYGRASSLNLPDEDTEREMYYKTDEILSHNGYKRYEISNYAKPDRECAHNLGYWRRTEYLGLGLNSSSFISETRFKNTSDIHIYINTLNSLSDIAWQTSHTLSQPYICNALIDEYDTVSLRDAMSEFMFLGLRTMRGIKKSDFLREFNTDIDSVYGDALKRFHDENLMETDGDAVRLTRRGIDLSNYVFSEFI